jgi:hypothetical protein
MRTRSWAPIIPVIGMWIGRGGSERKLRNSCGADPSQIGQKRNEELY